MSGAAAPLRWDIFCKVVDNYGDIGVCWRLARQVAGEHGGIVRLWVDDLASLARIRGGADAADVAGIEIRHWNPTQAFVIVAADVADVVIEAFGCKLPDGYLGAMARWPRMPCWINLEYLSAEEWVDGCHGLTSPHPRLPLLTHFVFPGFTTRTGGLLREHDLLARRDAFQNDAGAMDAFWRRLGLDIAAPGERRISMFAYAAAPLADLLRHWSQQDVATTLLVPEGVLDGQLAEFFDGVTRRGNLRLQVYPFLDQDDFDRLLWACDVNFVRGEDSFVRAQWAGRPFVWHIYPQSEQTHHVKLDAFLMRHEAGLEAPSATALRQFWDAWNGVRDTPSLHWPAFEARLPHLAAHARHWAARLAEQTDLATSLARLAYKHHNLLK